VPRPHLGTGANSAGQYSAGRAEAALGHWRKLRGAYQGLVAGRARTPRNDRRARWL